MKQLNHSEILNLLSDFSTDIETCDKSFVHQKLKQFWNFINEQDITKSILNKISKEYSDIGGKIEVLFEDRNSKHKRDYLHSFTSYEEQGACGFFLIQKVVQLDDATWPEIDLIENWFSARSTNSESKDDFIEIIFNPFIKLFDFYFIDFKSKNIEDYFSAIEIKDFNHRLDELSNKLSELSLGQEIIFDDIQELRDLLQRVKKKNWAEILKGKLFNLVIDNLITIENFEFIWKYVTGEDLKFLN